MLPRMGRTTLALDGKAIHVGSRKAVQGGDQIGAYPLWGKIIMVRHPRIRGPSAAVGTHHGSRHRFDSAANRGVVLAGHDLSSGGIDRFERGGAEQMHMMPRDRPGVV